MKGYRTLITNMASIIVMLAAAALQYADKLPITPGQAAILGVSSTIVMGLANMYLRGITTTPVGRSQ
jgi:hypothetical protein